MAVDAPARPDEGPLVQGIPPLDAGAVLQAAGHVTHLQRQAAAARLQAALSSPQGVKETELTVLHDGVRNMVMSDAWEQRLGALTVTQLLVQHGCGGPRIVDDAVTACSRLLEDEEPRVRLAAGDCLRAAAEREGMRVWDAVGERVLASITENLERSDEAGAAGGGAAGPGGDPDDTACATVQAAGAFGGLGGGGGADDFLGALLETSYERPAPGRGECRHDAEGWKCLETSFRALQLIMEGCGAAFRPALCPRIHALLARSAAHRNRYVRETGFAILAAAARLMEGALLEAAAGEAAQQLLLGLSDNWSQVRFAASVAARALLQAADEEVRDRLLFPLLLPPMCFNRYHNAEGVRSYSQGTWVMLLGQGGRAAVARYAPQVVDYYLAQSKSSNYALREVAASCMGELVAKVEPDAVRPHVPRMLRALLLALKDPSWPVRGAACLATGRAVAAYPDEATALLPDLRVQLLEHLSDNIFSVREDAAVALGDYMRAYGEGAVQLVAERCRDTLPCAAMQPATPPGQAGGASAAAGAGRAGTAVVGVRRAEEDAARLAEQQVFRGFSAGGTRVAFSTSLSSTRGGCCLDHLVSRPKEPWESADGAVYLLRELSGVAQARAAALLPALADAARLDGYAAAPKLQETTWRQLPKIAANIGKKEFKPHLELFLDPLFRSLKGDHANCAAAAASALQLLRHLLGPPLFDGRCSPDQLASLRVAGIAPV